jgi:hypothetical protein
MAGLNSVLARAWSAEPRVLVAPVADAIACCRGLMHNLSKDLDTALAFVIAQVEEEATRSGAPLDDEERYMLTHLPSTSVFPEWVDPESPTLIPRDLAYEKLCSLARAARVRDLGTRPGAEGEWDFAAAMFKLNRHPMSWLLQLAGLRERRPWWDRWLLVAAALLIILCGGAAMLFAQTHEESWTWVEWAIFGGACAAALASLYVASRRFGDWQLRKNVERFRHGAG